MSLRDYLVNEDGVTQWGMLKGLVYRTTKKIMHRYNLHHTVRYGPMEDGAIIHRCEWCGVGRVEHSMEGIWKKMNDELKSDRYR